MRFDADRRQNRSPAVRPRHACRARGVSFLLSPVSPSGCTAPLRSVVAHTATTAPADGKTACGKTVYTNGSAFVAADTGLLPFGTMVSVPGYNAGRPAPVLDRGRSMKGRRLDVFFLSHDRAAKWGARSVDVTVHAGCASGLSGRGGESGTERAIPRWARPGGRALARGRTGL